LGKIIRNASVLSDPVGAPDFTLPVSVVAQVIPQLDVNIAAQSIPTLNVNLSSVGDVTLNVNITGTPTINVQTSGGANIVIDKLTQAAYTERRSTLSNHGTYAGMQGATGNQRNGKFFPRGCRGFIKQVAVKVTDVGSAGGTATIYFSPVVGMGPVFSVSMNIPGGGTAWRTASVNKVWNYDSLFIFWVFNSADLQVNYSADLPNFDAYASTDGGVTWATEDRQYMVTVDLSGETVGDLPVSGTVNNIEVPAVATHAYANSTTIPAAGTVTLISIKGAGKHVYSHIYGSNEDDVYFRILCDGVEVDEISGDLFDGIITDKACPLISLYSWTSGGAYQFLLSVPYSFRRSFEIQAGNLNSATSRTAWVRRTVCNLIS
jgi:hypothetical protein